MKTFDLTTQLEQQLKERTEHDLCENMCHECALNSDHLGCWLENPTAGICPFLDGRA